MAINLSTLSGTNRHFTLHSLSPQSMHSLHADFINACVSSIGYLVYAGAKRQSRTSILESCRLKRSALGRRMHDIEKKGGGERKVFCHRGLVAAGVLDLMQRTAALRMLDFQKAFSSPPVHLQLYSKVPKGTFKGPEDWVDCRTLGAYSTVSNYLRSITPLSRASSSFRSLKWERIRRLISQSELVASVLVCSRSVPTLPSPVPAPARMPLVQWWPSNIESKSVHVTTQPRKPTSPLKNLLDCPDHWTLPSKCP